MSKPEVTVPLINSEYVRAGTRGSKGPRVGTRGTIQRPLKAASWICYFAHFHVCLWCVSYNSRPSAGPPGSTSDTMIDASLVSSFRLSFPPERAMPNPILESYTQEKKKRSDSDLQKNDQLVQEWGREKLSANLEECSGLIICPIIRRLQVWILMMLQSCIRVWERETFMLSGYSAQH